MKIIDMSQIEIEKFDLIIKSKKILEKEGIVLGVIKPLSGTITDPRTIYIEKDGVTVEFGLIKK